MNSQVNQEARNLAEQYALLVRPGMAAIPLTTLLVITCASDALTFGIAVAGWALIVSSYGIVTIHNNIRDRRIDIANKRKDNPLASGALSMQNVHYALAASITIGILSALYIGPEALLWLAIYVLCGWLYSGKPGFKNKGYLAITILGICYGIMPWILGYITASIQYDARMLVLAAAAFIFTAGVINLKDFKDLKGDRQFSKRTILVMKGPAYTQRFMIILVSLAYVLIFTYAAAQQATVLAALILIVYVLSIYTLSSKNMLQSSSYRGKYGTLVRASFFTLALVAWVITQSS